MRTIIACLLFFSCSLTVNAQVKTPSSTCISGHVETGQQTDTITLQFFDEFTIYQGSSNAIWKQEVITHDGNFRFNVPIVTKGSYFGLFSSMDGFDPNQLKLINYPINPGDSLHIYFNIKKTIISGRGSAKANCYSQILKRRWERIRSPIYSELLVKTGNLFQYMNSLDYASLLEIDVLNGFKDQLDPFDYDVLQANIEGERELVKYYNAQRCLDSPDTLTKSQLLKNLIVLLSNHLLDTTHADAKIYADQFITCAVKKLEWDYRWKQQLNPDTTVILDMVNAQHSGPLRDKIILEYLNRRVQASEVNEADLKKALQMVGSEIYKEKIQGLKRRFGKGEPAINFAFKDRANNTVHLSDLKGKVVFIDLWFTGCSACITVAKAMPDVEQAFVKNPQVVFLSVSVDSDRSLWLRSIIPDGEKAYKPTGQRYSHFTTSTTRYLYTGGNGSRDPFIEAYVPTNSYPHLLLIDKKGSIYASDPPRPDLENGKQELISLINRALKQN
jgi:thiol-disulfide isomerase/thioredoxin